MGGTGYPLKNVRRPEQEFQIAIFWGTPNSGLRKKYLGETPLNGRPIPKNLSGGYPNEPYTSILLKHN